MPYRRTSESTQSAEGWVGANDGATRPVHSRIDPLQYGTAEEDVDPGVQDLVPGGKANIEQQGVAVQL